MEVFQFGSEGIKNYPLQKGLLYLERTRDKVARIHDAFDGIVILDWLDSNNQSQCTERSFRKRFTIYGNGHVWPR